MLETEGAMWWWIGLLGCRAADVGDQAPTDSVRAPAVVLHDADGLRVERDAWRDRSHAFVAWRVRLSHDACLSVAAADGVVPFPTLLPTDAGPWAAVNGGFYELGAPMGLVVAGGTERSPLSARGGSGVLEASGTGPVVVRRDDYVAGSDAAVQSIDRLVDGGVSLVHGADGPRAARTVVAIADDAVWMVVMVDATSIDRDGVDVQLASTSGYGPTLQEAARYAIEQLGAMQVINLDGAVSTQMAVADGDFHLAVRGERGTIDAPVLRPRPAAGCAP